MKISSACATCPLKVLRATGFCADNASPTAKLALIDAYPNRDDLATGKPMAGVGGQTFLGQHVYPAGFLPEDLLIGNVLRCYPNGGFFPIGTVRQKAIAHCARHHDQAIQQFHPDVAMVTIAPWHLISLPNQEIFMKRALEKSRKLIDRGHKVLLLMGDEAKEKYMPSLNGGLKKWQGWYGKID